MNDNIKLCYSFSARIDILGFIDLIHSLHTAKQWFKKDDIIVFFTPPFNNDYERQIAKYATIIKKDHYPIAHPFFEGITPPFYWDKYYFTEMNCDNLIFLDNDTELQTDIRAYFKDDFDIMVFGEDIRADARYIETWNKTWNYFNMPAKLNLMTTVILFKNQTHKKLKKELKNVADKYIVEQLFEYPAEDRLFDEYVFSLATRNYNIVIRPKNEDMLWTGVGTELERENAPILHGGARKLFSINTRPTEKEVFSEDLLKLIKQCVPVKHWIERIAATFLTMMEDVYPGFKLYFELKNNAIIMHTNIELVPNTVEYIMSYVWAEPPENQFIVINDLK